MGDLLADHGWSFIEYPFGPEYVVFLKSRFGEDK